MHRQTVFKLGDKVRSKFGGPYPYMEILRHDGMEFVCTWWAQGQMEKATFAVGDLVAVKTSN